MKIVPNFIIMNEPKFVQMCMKNNNLLNIEIIKFLEFSEIVKASLLCKQIYIIIDPNAQTQIQEHLSYHFWHVIFA